MPVDVELFGGLLPGAPRRQTVALGRTATAEELAETLGLDPGEVGLVIINGVQCEADSRVPDGSRICFFPPLSGG